MEITGPVAPPEPAPRRTGLIAGCLSGCASTAALLAAMLTTGAGAVYEFTQPHHRSRASVPDGTCEFAWWRSAFGGARYRITCDARKDLTLKRFKLLSGPRGVTLVESSEDWGQAPWEDQRPLSGETVTVEAGRTWTYDGSISLGLVPYLGPDATVTLTMSADGKLMTLEAVE